MNEELVKHQLQEHEERINSHSKKIDYLEQQTCTVNTKIETLCDQLKNLTQTIKWGIGIITTITLFVLGYLISR